MGNKAREAIKNYDRGITFVIGYLSYSGYISSLDISKWLIPFKTYCDLFFIKKA